MVASNGHSGSSGFKSTMVSASSSVGAPGAALVEATTTGSGEAVDKAHGPTTATTATTDEAEDLDGEAMDEDVDGVAMEQDEEDLDGEAM